MSKVLIINASARGEGSLSRYMTKVFAENWQEIFPDDQINHREVGMEPIPHVTEKWITAAFKPSESRSAEDREALKISNQLVAELKETDVVVLGTPMYNWSVPSALKAYIDQVLRVNETVLINSDTLKNPYKGLLKDKKAYLLMARGNYGYEPGEFYEHMDFQTNYLKTVFRIMGINEVSHMAINGVGLSKESSLAIAEEKVKKLIDQENR